MIDPLVRPAILTSALGYSLAGLAIAIDVDVRPKPVPVRHSETMHLYTGCLHIPGNFTLLLQ